tara:strand:- start:151 stop:711 length:561 start_codon:yes stop_codon:yes gene_type:complete
LKKNSLDISTSIKWLESGKILIHPTESIWGLGCDAFNKKAVENIFAIKKRDQKKSFILLCESLDFLKEYADKIAKEDEILLNETWPGAVTFLVKYNNKLPEHLKTSSGKIAVRVSNHLPLKTLISSFKSFMVSTSANLSGEDVFDNPDAILDFFESDQLAYYDGELGPNKRPSKIIDLDTKSVIRG